MGPFRVLARQAFQMAATRSVDRDEIYAGSHLRYSRGMKRFLTVIAALLLMIGVAWAQPSGSESPILTRILAIADPDQVHAFTQLKLTQQQQRELQSAAISFLPKVKNAQSDPTGVFRLVPEALGLVDGILTPNQRPLARKLVPRAHQWGQLRALYDDYRP